jgi:diazepam-binding inhibitor (GABA receptor modulator, acyl-CoA-binding protein)
MADLANQFAEAQERVKTLKTKPDNDTLLELYSFYKQATEGDCNIPPPKGLFDIAGRAKYEAWIARKGLSNDKAMTQYIKLVNSLLARER